MTHQNRNYGLDLARCIAIVSVFMYHAYSSIFQQYFPFVWYSAVGGVELFFALSGFLIGSILLNLFISSNGKLKINAIIQFWVRRWLRTLPLYFFIYLCLLATSYIGYKQSFDFRYVFFLQNFTTPPTSFFGESWSLCIEEWFYLLFPLFLFFFSLFFNQIKSKLSVFLFSLLGFISIITFLRWINYNVANQDVIVLFRLDAIAFGVLAAYISFRFPSLKLQSKKILIFSFILIALAIVIKFKSNSLGIYSLIYYPIAGLGFSSFVLGLNYYNWKKKFKVVMHISKISYSIYLTHLSLILYSFQIVINPNSKFEKVLFLLVYTLVVWAVSVFTYFYIEKPVIKWRDKKFNNLG